MNGLSSPDCSMDEGQLPPGQYRFVRRAVAAVPTLDQRSVDVEFHFLPYPNQPAGKPSPPNVPTDELDITFGVCGFSREILERNNDSLIKLFKVGFF